MPGDPDHRPLRTRLAPSPTGALHLGNARTFLINWGLARARGWRVVMRIEDLDSPRVKGDATAGVLRTLEWLGLDWDEGPYIQSEHLDRYREAVASLAARGLVFPCALTRKEIAEAVSAPHEREQRFPPDLRPDLVPRAFENEETNWRLVVEPGAVPFHDGFAGPQSIDVSETVGDFPVWTKRGVPAYQLAVAVDDAHQNITHVLRGDDLLDSTARQLHVYAALGLHPPDAWIHVPLVTGTDGRRLAKRHGDTRLDTYRERGVTPERIVGLLAKWCGIGDGSEAKEMSAREFAARIDLDTIPPDPVVFTPEEEAWLTAPRHPA